MAIKTTCILIISSITFISCLSFDRTNQQLYVDIFGKSVDTCVQIIETRDENAIDDQMLYLHFKACPKEMKRIFSLAPYSFEGISKSMMEANFNSRGNTNESLIPYIPKWWDIRTFGDSCIYFHYKHPYEDYVQEGYMSLDSSEVFYKAISY